MLKKLFGRNSKETPGMAKNPTIDAIQHLIEQEESVNKRKELLERRMDGHTNEAKHHLTNKQQAQALLCLKKKKMLGQELTTLDNMALQLAEQRAMLESQATVATVAKAIQAASQQAKQNLLDMKLVDLDKMADLVEDNRDEMERLHDIMGQSVGNLGIDEDELLQELEELGAADLDMEALEAATAPTSRVPAAATAAGAGVVVAQRLPAAPTNQVAVGKGKTAEELELEQMQAEMALA